MSGTGGVVETVHVGIAVDFEEEYSDTVDFAVLVDVLLNNRSRNLNDLDSSRRRAGGNDLVGERY